MEGGHLALQNMSTALRPYKLLLALNRLGRFRMIDSYSSPLRRGSSRELLRVDDFLQVEPEASLGRGRCGAAKVGSYSPLASRP